MTETVAPNSAAADKQPASEISSTPVPEAFQNAYKFAMEHKVDRAAHFVGTIITTITGRLDMFFSLSPGGAFANPALLEKQKAKGNVITPDQAKELIMAVIKTVIEHPELGSQRLDEVRRLWNVEARRKDVDDNNETHKATDLRNLRELIGVPLGTSDQPWDPFVELGIQ